MLQEGGPEMGGGGAPGEGGEGLAGGPGEGVSESREASAESKKKFAQQQAAVKQLWKEEKRHRQDDSKVANIIIKFLQDPAHTKFFILIARLVARNLSSAFILALLSLIHKESAEATQGEIQKLEAGKAGQIEGQEDNEALPAGEEKAETALETKEETTQALEAKPENDFKKLPPHIKQKIDEWTKDCYKVGEPIPNKMVQALMNPDGSIEDTLFQLATFILQEYLDKNSIKNDYDDVRGFIEVVFTSIVNKYKKVVDDNKMLAEQAAAKKAEEKPEPPPKAPPKQAA